MNDAATWNPLMGIGGRVPKTRGPPDHKATSKRRNFTLFRVQIGWILRSGRGGGKRN